MPNIIIKEANAAAAALSFLAALVTRGGKACGMPPAVGIELTNHCNLKCPECSSGSGMMKRERGFMSMELFEKAVSELKPCLDNMNLYFQGESMMHPEFFGMLGKALLQCIGQKRRQYHSPSRQYPQEKPNHGTSRNGS